MYRTLLPVYLGAFHQLDIEKECIWGAHAEAMAAQPRLGPDVVALCLSHLGILAVALPLPAALRPANCSWTSATHACRLLVFCPMVADALPAHIEAADGASLAAMLAAAAQLAQHVPLNELPYSGEELSCHVTIVLAVAQLLGWLCGVFGDVAHRDTAVLARLDKQQRQRVVHALLGSLGRWPGLLNCVAGGNQLEPRLLDMLRGGTNQMLTLRALRDGVETTDSLQQAAAWCGAACDALQSMPLVQELHWADTADSVPPIFEALLLDATRTAAKAAASALDMLQLFSRPATPDAAALCTAAGQLHSMLAQLVHFMVAADRPLCQLRDEGTACRLLRPMNLCLVAAMARLRTGEQTVQETRQAAEWEGITLLPLCGDPDAIQSWPLAEWEGITLLPLCGDPDAIQSWPPCCRQLQAICAAHAAALLACDALCPVNVDGENAATLYGLGRMLAAGPMTLSLDPALHKLFKNLWKAVSKEVRPGWRVAEPTANLAPAPNHAAAVAASLQPAAQPDSGTDGERVCSSWGHMLPLVIHAVQGSASSSFKGVLWGQIMSSATQAPCMAALLASGDYLDAIVKGAAQVSARAALGGFQVCGCHALSRTLPPVQGEGLLAGVRGVLDALHAAAATELAMAGPDDTAGSGGSYESTSAAPSDEAEALERLRLAYVALDAVMPQPGASVAAGGLRRGVLPHARQLAGALLDWWRRPGAQQEQQLEAALAAATRSCAYLRCANLSGSSGPAAGSGKGSKRCR